MTKRFLVIIYTGVVIVFLLLAFPSLAQAKTCYRQQGYDVCLEQVQRSAKYHWRYKVKATIDNQKQPLTWYDCRDRTQTAITGASKGVPEKFLSNGIGAKVCQLVDR